MSKTVELTSAQPAATSARADPLLRFALRLHACLAKGRGPLAAPRGLADSVRRLSDAARSLEWLVRQTATARRRHWHAAADRLLGQIPATARRVAAEAGMASRAAAAATVATTDRSTPCVAELLPELRGLRSEFGGLRLDPRRGSLAVEIDPVVLDGVALGPFRVELHLGDPRTGRIGLPAVRCVALEPNPAAACRLTTHPHVRDDVPCLGEAAGAVAAALRDGRLTDAFLAVAAVLRTYNPESPYVPLEEWDGRSCDDCGRHRAEDDLSTCAACGSVVCNGCCGRCDACDDGCCLGCLERDGEGGGDLCPDCRGRCTECGDVAATSSLDEHGGRCANCAEAASPDRCGVGSELNADDGAASEPAVRPGDPRPAPLTSERNAYKRTAPEPLVDSAALPGSAAARG